MNTHTTLGASARFLVLGTVLAGSMGASPSPAAPSEGELRKLAVSLTGVHYREGGRTRSTGLDAGGLVALLYARAGIDLPPREEELAQRGTRIGVDELEPWDLVVLAAGGAKGQAAVGLALGGKDFLLCSRETGRVVIARMDEALWQGRLVLGRRLWAAKTAGNAESTRAPAAPSSRAPEVPSDRGSRQAPLAPAPGQARRPPAGELEDAEEDGEDAESMLPREPRSRKRGSSRIGMASYYGGSDGLSGSRTSSGERLSSRGFTAAHRTLPFGTKVKVTNLQNGKWVIVRINDRGPFRGGRLIDVSYAAARRLGFLARGITRVRLDVF